MSTDESGYEAAKRWIESLRKRDFKSDVMFVDYHEPHNGKTGQRLPATVVCANCDSTIKTSEAIVVKGDFYCNADCLTSETK